ncbi:unnamed protein product, partial [Rotaria socialis]
MTSADRFLDADQELQRRLPSIGDFENEPVISLEEAVKKLQSLTYLYDYKVVPALNKMRHLRESLTLDEAAAIHLYTMWHQRADSAIAIQLNRALRSGDASHIKRWLSYLKLFVTGLNKLPPKKGTIWRFTRGDITARFQNECIWSGFSSCTGTKSVMTRAFDPCGVYTVFKIECINGKSISNYSERPDQDEVLLMPGTRLRVLDKHYQGDDIYIVYLEEVESQNQLSPYRPSYTSPMNQSYRTDQGLPSPSIQPSKKSEVPQLN